MPFVKRSEHGRILGVYREQVTPDLEPVAAEDSELRSFVAELGSDDPTDEAAVWIRSDLAMARVVEDLVDTLIDRNVIGFGDLPEEARSKIVARRRRRADLDYLQSLEIGDPDAEDPDAG